MKTIYSKLVPNAHNNRLLIHNKYQYDEDFIKNQEKIIKEIQGDIACSRALKCGDVIDGQRIGSKHTYIKGRYIKFQPVDCMSFYVSKGNYRSRSGTPSFDTVEFDLRQYECVGLEEEYPDINIWTFAYERATGQNGLRINIKFNEWRKK